MKHVWTDAEALSHEPGDRDDHSGRQVFEILTRENADMLVAYLRSLVRSADAVDDLFQEVMLTAWKRFDDYDADRPFGPWLRGIARNRVLKHRDRCARDVLNCDSDVLDALESRFEGRSQTCDGFRESVERLLFCLRRLPDRLREAIELTYQHGLLLRQVAGRLGASEEAVKKRVQRARRLLACCIRTPEATA
jgi:RNA polymerase sigma-70 factor (ECF subfamily)